MKITEYIFCFHRMHQLLLSINHQYILHNNDHNDTFLPPWGAGYIVNAFLCRFITFWLDYRRFRWVVVCTFEVWVLFSLWMNSHNCFALPALPKIVASLSCDNVKSSWILSTFLMTDLKKIKKKYEKIQLQNRKICPTHVRDMPNISDFLFIADLQIYNLLLFISLHRMLLTLPAFLAVCRKCVIYAPGKCPNSPLFSL